ncbi:hypothetical protein DFH11DRAFT_1809203, partial [Phellopilus nigrolimitatus]
MAGDHKCPVCQATFTRPQHVARHMRSHTGDRPYKCQHCGDQFARSDLLSRHVNKCHAGDKPPITTAPTRRKGQHGSSSTRATTSKQACDQCVIATLPCDGANPCSKCVQRKGPCTYVKFQRQTAPSGPGHKHSHSVDSGSTTSSGLSTSVPHPDELFLGPPPMTVPSMNAAGELFYPNTQFAFSRQPGAPNWESDSPNPPSLSLSATTDSGHDSSSPDLAAHFRNSEMLRASMVPPGYAPGTAGPNLIPSPGPNAFYNAQQQPQQQHGLPADPWQVPTDYNLTMQHRKMEDGFAQYLPPGSSSQLGGPSSLLNPANLDFHGGGLYNLQTRRGSVDQFSDGGSGASAPNSAASSSVHLPLDFGISDQQQQQLQPQDLMPYPQFEEDQQPPPSRDGRFATSFELMSLTDADGQYVGNFNDVNPEGNAPFFTQHAMKLPPQDSTPRPFRGDDGSLHNGQPSSPRDRETEMRELREFWKQYLRTPLTGPSLEQTPKAELLNNQLGGPGDVARPTPKRGLSRVASLPSVRTPPDEKMDSLPSRVNNGHNHTHLPVVQTTDDLKSYEQAVMARKPLNLNFVPRKGRLSVSSSASPQPIPPDQQMHHQGFPPHLSFEPGPLAGLQDGGSSSDDNPPMSATSAHRPSFKRLPSQTLENTVQKRALFRWGGNEDAVEDTDSETDGPSAANEMHPAHGGGGNSANMNQNNYHRNMFAHSETLLDRFRRQSAPTTMRPAVGELAHMVDLHEHSPSPVSYATSPLQASQPNGGVPHMSVMAPRP